MHVRRIKLNCSKNNLPEVNHPEAERAALPYHG
jgi:hypothetical protein